MSNICVTRSKKLIPSTMVTQHPDNANVPYWHVCDKLKHICEFISTQDEIEECFLSFSDLGCQEYMWDWEGKFVDEAVYDRLLTKYSDFFKKNQLGRDVFLTYRIPNIWKEKTARIARAFMGLLTANEEAERNELNHPPIFEVVLPQTDDAKKLIHMQNKFNQISKYYTEIFEVRCDMNHFSIIPLIEGSEMLINSKEILLDYIKLFEEKFSCKIDYIRPFIARSDPALESGFIPATIAAKTAISEYYKFEQQTGIKVYPMIGAGSLNFRGGLSPNSVDDFMENYPGIRTVTVQSAFRYDYPLRDVKTAIEKLNKDLPKCTPKIHPDKELKAIKSIDKIFGNFYRETIAKITHIIVKTASYVPSHRERIQFSGSSGYGRRIKGSKAKFPRAIKFTASLYSLGIPPEFIGTGRGINKIMQTGDIQTLEHFIKKLKNQLIEAGNYLNKRNLNLLIKKIPGFQDIKMDIEFIEKYIDVKLGPVNDMGRKHSTATNEILDSILNNKEPKRILEAARLRRSLG